MTLEELWDYVSEMAVNYGLKTLGAIVLLFVAWIIAGWLASMADRALRKARLDETLSKFVGKLIRWLLLLLAILACLSIFGVETTAFAAAIGAAGLSIGLAFQGTLGNFASGIMLLVFRPFNVGDVVNISGQTGKIFEIGIFTTSLDTFDNRRFIIPNGAIFGSTIENINYHPHRRADVDVGVSYSADIDRTRELLMQAIKTVENGLEDPSPAVVLLSLGDSAVNWSVRVWAEVGNFGQVKQDLTRAVKVTLDEAGVEIPFPQMDVHLPKASGEG